MNKGFKRFLLLIFISMFIFSGYKITKYFLETNKSKKLNKKIVRRQHIYCKK